MPMAPAAAVGEDEVDAIAETVADAVCAEEVSDAVVANIIEDSIE